MSQWAVITGGSNGIGRALANHAAKDKLNVVLVARDSVALDTAARELQAQYQVETKTLAGDITNDQVLADLVGLTSNLEVVAVINAAGFGAHGSFVSANWATMDQMLALNCRSLTFLTRHYTDKLQANGGFIMNVASVAGFFPGANMAAYYATKAYVLSLTQAINYEMRNSPLYLTALCPGPTDSGFAKAAQAEATSIFKGKLTTAEQVASYGWRAMKRKKAVAIYPASYRWFIWASRFMPRQMLVAMVARSQA